MRRVLVFAGIGLALLAACGTGTDTADADRTIVITMRDNEFEPDRVEVERGETIAFRFVNRGKSTHDAFIGTKAEQKDHERDMMSGGGHGEHASQGPGGVTVESGETETFTHTFATGGRPEIGCHQPGHYAAGMVAEVRVR
jgi:uncharacterized cupredoxin-like copper-binding protein